jgi:hypothetical protein
MKLKDKDKTVLIIVLIVTVIVLSSLLVTSVFSTINQNLETESKPVRDSQYMSSALNSSPAYIAFIHRYPNNQMHHNDTTFPMSHWLAQTNPKTHNTLRLDLVFDLEQDRIFEKITCSSPTKIILEGDNFKNKEVMSYILKTDCIEDPK